MGMVRRHRIGDEELPYIIDACYHRLVDLTVEYRIDEETRSLFRFLWRITEHRKGNPHYPKLGYWSIKFLIRKIEKEFNIESYFDELVQE
jgi:hypothetical protein